MFCLVWFAQNGERLGTYDGHNGAVYGLVVDYYTRRVLSGSADNTAKLWNARTGQQLYTWEFKTAVRSVEFALGDREGWSSSIQNRRIFETFIESISSHSYRCSYG